MLQGEWGEPGKIECVTDTGGRLISRPFSSQEKSLERPQSRLITRFSANKKAGTRESLTHTADSFPGSHGARFYCFTVVTLHCVVSD